MLKYRETGKFNVVLLYSIVVPRIEVYFLNYTPTT